MYVIEFPHGRYPDLYLCKMYGDYGVTEFIDNAFTFTSSEQAYDFLDEVKEKLRYNENAGNLRVTSYGWRGN